MFDVNHLVEAGGLFVIAAIIFAESGMMVGFFFPGDTLLFSAGIFAATGKLSIAAIITVACLAAIAGDNVGYQIGRSLGPRLFRKKDGLIFRHDYIMRAEKFYEVYGSKTMLLAHFIPIVRTFAAVTAGAGKMNRAKFAFFDAIGDCAWAIAITLLGYYAGRHIPNVEQYVMPVLALVIIVSFGPALYHAFKDPKIRAAVLHKFRRQNN